MKLPSDTEFQLMAILAARELAGREVAKRYKEETGSSISYGTLYTTLRRLADIGLVRVRDDEDEDGRLRYFSLTASGARALQTSRARYERLAGFSLLPKEAG